MKRKIIDEYEIYTSDESFEDYKGKDSEKIILDNLPEKLNIFNQKGNDTVPKLTEKKSVKIKKFWNKIKEWLTTTNLGIIILISTDLILAMGGLWLTIKIFWAILSNL